MKPESKHPLRCTCRTEPLLAYYGRNSRNRAYVHVAAFKNKRTITQVYSTDPISIWCPACGRWWNIFVRNNQLTAEERSSSPPVPEQKSKSRVVLDNPPDDQ